MKVLIIEDERIAADKLGQMLQVIDPAIEILAKPGSIRESVTWLLQHSADLIFLDIQLSDGISFSIFDQVAVNTPVIFTTAYDQYAIRAFQLNSIAYLLKPVRSDELIESLKKYQQLKTAFSIDFETLLAGIQGRKPEYRKRFLIQIGEKIKKIELTDVAWFYSLEKGTYVKTFTGHSWPVEFSLERLTEIIDPAVFFRVNRKLIVNMSSIKNMVAYSRGRIKLELEPGTGDESDPVVSIDRSAPFRKWLNG